MWLGVKLYRGFWWAFILGVTSLPVNAQEVYVTIPPLRFAAESLLGKEVAVLLPPGQNPHTYSPSAKQIARLTQAKVLFTTGVPFEKPLLDRVVQLAPQLKIVETDKGLTKRTFSENEAHEHDMTCAHNDWDPHVWLSPQLYRKQVDVIALALGRVYPELRPHIEQNNNELQQQLKEMDEKLKVLLGSSIHRKVMVYHPAFGYFCDEYGIEQLAVEVDGKEPTAAQLSRLIQTARDEKIEVIFVQRQFPAVTAKSIADAIGGNVISVDPLSEDYLNNIKSLAHLFKTSESVEKSTAL